MTKFEVDEVVSGYFFVEELPRSYQNINFSFWVKIKERLNGKK